MILAGALALALALVSALFAAPGVRASRKRRSASRST